MRYSSTMLWLTPNILLEGWDNFYVILGSAAAGLMGLTFVVIALLSDAPNRHPSGMRGYITPTVVHFGAVLALAAFVSMPRQNVLSLSLGFGAVGIGGLIYTGVIVANMRQFAIQYVPVREDWIWHAIWPTVVYGAMFAMALLVWRDPVQTLYGMAVSLTLLLFVGVHNAWDVAVSVTGQKQKDAKKEKEKD
jgi:hypothetical protein